MSYYTMSMMAQDATLFDRIKCCAAEQGIPSHEADKWTDDQRLRFAAAPGWHVAWESALTAGIETPGAHPGVISDGMILAEVQIAVHDYDVQHARKLRVAAWDATDRPATMRCENPLTNVAQDTL